ncbi:MAG: HEPN domain-containing protein [Thermoanaerobaculia bacterium]|nr:HEPN domain-containing protein [Thermoanaerobaculia bacterium]
MTGEGRRAAVHEELAASEEEIAAAERLLESDLARVALTRVYFALFHAVRALLYAHGHEPRSHAGARTLFGRHFVKEGAFTPADGRLLTRLQRQREKADYASESEDVTVENVERELEPARALIQRIRLGIEEALS